MYPVSHPDPLPRVTPRRPGLRSGGEGARLLTGGGGGRWRGDRGPRGKEAPETTRRLGGITTGKGQTPVDERTVIVPVVVEGSGGQGTEVPRPGRGASTVRNQVGLQGSRLRFPAPSLGSQDTEDLVPGVVTLTGTPPGPSLDHLSGV